MSKKTNNPFVIEVSRVGFGARFVTRILPKKKWSNYTLGTLRFAKRFPTHLAARSFVKKLRSSITLPTQFQIMLERPVRLYYTYRATSSVEIVDWKDSNTIPRQELIELTLTGVEEIIRILPESFQPRCELRWSQPLARVMGNDPILICDCGCKYDYREHMTCPQCSPILICDCGYRYDRRLHKSCPEC